jgi:SPP1 family phage portal protein
MILDLNIAKKLHDEYNSNLSKYNMMYNYYIGKTDLINYPKTDRSNRIVPTNYIKKFVDEETSFAVGNKVTYISASNNINLLNAIDYNIENQKGAIDIELTQTMEIFGIAYELRYINNEEFKVKVIKPTQGIAYCDTEGQAGLFLYFYKLELDNTTYIDVFDDKFIYHFKDDFEKIAEPTEHFFGKCPVGVAKLPEREYSTLYNDIKGLQDNYEYTMSDYSNEIGDTRLAYLVFNGLSIDEAEADKMKQMGILQTSDPNGKVQWLIKNISPEFIKSFIDTVENKIYEISQHINHNIAPASNTSGVALQTRLISLRNKINIVQNCLSDCLKSRIKCLITYLNLREGTNHNYKDVSIKYTMNVPSNDVEMAQIITQLNGKLSAGTGLNQLSFITNGDQEFEKALAEMKSIEDATTPPVNLDDEVGEV